MLGPLDHSAAVAARLGPALAPLVHEEMWLLALDGRNHARSARKVAQGGVHSCALTPPDVLRASLYEAATAFILVHNHPSDDPTPSPEDLVATRRIAEAGRLLGVPLVDHVIVAPSGQLLLDARPRRADASSQPWPPPQAGAHAQAVALLRRPVRPRHAVEGERGPAPLDLRLAAEQLA